MKNLMRITLLFFAVGCLIVLTNCGSDNEPEPVPSPTISVSASSDDAGTLNDGGQVEATDKVWFTINITATGGFNVFRVSGDLTQEFTRNDLQLGEGATSALVEFTYQTTASEHGSTITLNFQAVDDLDQTTDGSFTFDIATSPNAKVYSQVLLAAPLEDNSANSFLDIHSNIVYNNTDGPGSSANIDIGYAYIDNAIIASPSVYPLLDVQNSWPNRNSTQMWKLDMTSETYASMTTVADVTEKGEEYVDQTDIDNPGTYSISDLVNGDIVYFTTEGTFQDRLRGFFRVVEISGTFNQGDGIELEFILETAAD